MIDRIVERIRFLVFGPATDEWVVQAVPTRRAAFRPWFTGISGRRKL